MLVNRQTINCAFAFSCKKFALFELADPMRRKIFVQLLLQGEARLSDSEPFLTQKFAKKMFSRAILPYRAVANFRHLFARTYYSLQKDIVRLADILGHSNINTTRIYTAESGTEHMKQLQKLDFLRC